MARLVYAANLFFPISYTRKTTVVHTIGIAVESRTLLGCGASDAFAAVIANGCLVWTVTIVGRVIRGVVGGVIRGVITRVVRGVVRCANGRVDRRLKTTRPNEDKNAYQ